MAKFISDEEMAKIEGQSPKKKFISDEEMFSIESPPEEESLMSKAYSLGGKAVDTGLKGLDYLGGIRRTGGAIVGGLLTGKNLQEVAPDQEIKDSLMGKRTFPDSAEYMKRLDVPEGARVDLNPFAEGDSSLRDVVGFGLDMAADPTTFAKGKGAKALGNTTEKAGKSLFKSGLKKIDERVIERGAKPFSDLALKEGLSGTTKQIAKQTDELIKKLGPKRKALYDEAQKLGVTIDASAITKNADEIIKKMKTDPGLAPKAEALEQFVNRYKGQGFIDVPTASDWKSNLYDSLPDSAFGPKGQLRGQAKKVEQALAKDFKEAIIKASDKGRKGLGKEIDEINQAFQTSFSAQKPLVMQVRRSNTPNLVTGSDPILGGLGAVLGGPEGAAALIAAKKAADLSKTTAFRTRAGKGLIRAGKSGAIDPLVRQSLLGIMRDEDEDTE